MKVCGVQTKMINVVRATLLNSTCQMQISGIEKEVIMKEGSGQGTTLGPTLCNFFFLPLLQEFERKMMRIVPTVRASKEMGGHTFNAFTHNFADDTCMITDTIQDAETVAREFNTFMKQFKSKVHVATSTNPISKSIVVYYPATNVKNTQTTLPVNADGSEWINFEKGSPYLGSFITASLRDDDEIRGRIKKASQMFGKLRRKLLGSKDTWNQVKIQVLQGMILPMMLDGAEHWVITANMMNELLSAYHKMIRGCMRVTTYTTRKHRITNEDLIRRLGMEPLQYYIDWRILGYAGHIQRMKNDRLPKLMRDATVVGKGEIGAPHKSHNKQLHESLKRKGMWGLNWKTAAMDKEKWRKMLKSPSVLPPRTSAAKVQTEWTRNPELAIGRKTEKKFNHKYHIGTVCNFDIDTDTNDVIWEVQYDDGDNEDLNAKELDKVICEIEDEHLFRE